MNILQTYQPQNQNSQIRFRKDKSLLPQPQTWKLVKHSNHKIKTAKSNSAKTSSTTTDNLHTQQAPTSSTSAKAASLKGASSLLTFGQIDRQEVHPLLASKHLLQLCVISQHGFVGGWDPRLSLWGQNFLVLQQVGHLLLLVFLLVHLQAVCSQREVNRISAMCCGFKGLWPV